MQLADYVRILRRRAPLIFIAAVFGMVGAYVATSQQAKIYRTDAQFIVSVTQSGPSGDIARRPLAVAEAVALSQLASTPTAIAAAAAEAGGATGGSVSATADNNSPFINLTVTGGDPVAIAQIANAFVKVLPQVQRTLRQAEAGTVVTLIADQPAPVPTVAISPRPKQNLAIGLALGLILGLGAALVREALDRRVLDSADLERASGLTRLGSIPKELDDELLPARSHPRSMRAEAYRMVRANVQFTDLAGTTPVLLVTSSNPGDGKTSLATNLAVSCALAGERVVIIDGDLRQPRVGAHFGIDRGPGLSDVLRGRQSLDLATTVMEGLDVLTSGPVPPNPSELLGSPRMVELLDHLALRYDRVILDGPPVLAVVDAVKLASFVTGVVLVLRIGATTVDELNRAKQSLDQSGARVVGISANRVRPGQDGAFGYGSSLAYGYAPEPTKRRRRSAPAPAVPLFPSDIVTVLPPTPPEVPPQAGS